MLRRRWAPVLLVASLLPGGCVLLASAPLPDAHVPTSLRAAVEPARRALTQGWPHEDQVSFRFLDARCVMGGAAVLVFEQRTGGEPPDHALAFTHDVAAGIITGSWWERFDVVDPDADPELQRLVGDREMPCP